MIRIKVSELCLDQRVDRFLQSELKEFSRTDIQKLIASEQVLFEGKPVAKNFRLEPEMEIQVLSLPEKEESNLEPEDIPLDIVYEDEDIVVINKPRRLVVHPGSGIRSGTLAAALLFHFKENLSQVGGPLRPGIVHRLDKDTPGLMVVAKNDKAHLSLSSQLEMRTLKRTYNALVWGQPRDLEGTIDAPIERDSRNRLKMAVSPNGKEARTHYKILEFYAFASLLELDLETGRTHQIRVHNRYMGNPVFGDPLYDGRDACLMRIPPLLRETAAQALEMSIAQLLQAVKLTLRHPRTGKMVTFEIPLEDQFENVLEYLRENAICDSPSLDQTFFRDFESDRRYVDETDIKAEVVYPYEEPPIKTRMTREEHLLKKKDRIARRKEIELEKRRKKEERAAIRRGEIPEDIVLPGYEPTIDPNLLAK
ncbi:MAG TPA: RluA family pseudouridine synthase [Fibrobacter sp.]|nr:RluA family pseudouridine synthase [Fibrobacter sp.]